MRVIIFGQTLKRFPNVDGIMVNAELTNIGDCAGLI